MNHFEMNNHETWVHVETASRYWRMQHSGHPGSSSFYYLIWGVFPHLHLHGHRRGTFFLRLVNLLKLLVSWLIHVEFLWKATVWQMWTVIFLLLSSSDICLHQPLWMIFPARKCEFIFILSLLSLKCILLNFGFTFGEFCLHFTIVMVTVPVCFCVLVVLEEFSASL